MKLLVVHETLGWFGGVEQNIAVVVAGLRQRGHRVSFVHFGQRARDPEGYAQLFDDCVELPGPTTAAGDRAFKELLDEQQPDVVYLHKLARLPDVLVQGSGIRSVRMIHDHDLCCPRRHGYTAWRQRICRSPAGWRCWFDAAFLARPGPLPGGLRFVSPGAVVRELHRNRRLDRLLVGSRFMAEELERNGFGAEQLAVLPPVLPSAGSQPGSAVPARPSAAESPSTPPKLLYVGQHIRGKGIDLMLRALARVERPWTLELLGEGNARSKLEALATTLGIQDRVHFRGWVDHDQLEDSYLSARALIVPSRWAEPFGMIGLEAMQRGRPVIAFAVGGIPDWCEHERTGLLVPEGDVAALALAVTRLLDDPALAKRLGDTARGRVAERFSFESYLDALEAELSSGER